MQIYKDRENITLRRIIEINVRQHLPEVEIILRKKLDEYFVESTITNIIHQWTTVRFLYEKITSDDLEAGGEVEGGEQEVEEEISLNSLQRLIEKAREHLIELQLVKYD